MLPQADTAAHDGTLALIDGRVVHRAPVGSGRRPTIIPGRHIRVIVNGHEIRTARMIGEGDEIEVKPIDTPPYQNVRVQVSDDRMQASIHLVRRSGTRCNLPELQPRSELLVYAVPVERVLPPPLTIDQLHRTLEESGVTFGIDNAALAELANETGEVERVVRVASGKPAEQSTDGKIELLDRRPEKFDEEAARVDLLAHSKVLTVQHGEVIAVRHEPVQGSDGVDVRGRTVKARKPRNVTLVAGWGATLSEDGSTAFAARAGRPVVRKNVASVFPVHEIDGDVGIETGHIDFDGDVYVRGSVADQLRVEAGGEVQVGGSVGRAYIKAKQGVRIRKAAVGTVIDAGGEAALASRMRGLVERLAEQVRALERATKELAQASTRRGQDTAIGALVKTLLERRFREIENVVDECEAHVEELGQTVDGAVHQAVKAAKLVLVGRGPLELRDTKPLLDLAEALDTAHGHLDAVVSTKAEVAVGYLQNARLAASGRVTITGKACYHSEIDAGEGVSVPSGVIRGGRVTAHRGDVVARELGSASGAVTHIRVDAGGRIRAMRVFPNVICWVGPMSLRFADIHAGLDLHLDRRGELVKS